jgi:hypothetical protein
MIVTVPKNWEYNGTYVSGKYQGMRLVIVLPIAREGEVGQIPSNLFRNSEGLHTNGIFG